MRYGGNKPMNGAKITQYFIACVLIVDSISYFAYRQLGNTINNSEANAVLETPEQDSSGTVYNGFNTPKLNVTIKNGSGNRLICLSYQNKEPKQFLSLEGKQERQFENIDEGEYIGCSISTGKDTSTILNWFHITSPGTYTLSLEIVECKTCTGQKSGVSTVVTKPNGEKEYRQM